MKPQMNADGRPGTKNQEPRTEFTTKRNASGVCVFRILTSRR
jgi:hypothetical protein